MPHKSKSKRFQSKTTAQSQSQSLVENTVNTAAVNAAGQASPALNRPKPAAKVPQAQVSAEVALAGLQYPYVGSEIKRITLLAAVLIIVLIVLAIVL
jgi:hypothetical protein